MLCNKLNNSNFKMKGCINYKLHWSWLHFFKPKWRNVLEKSSILYASAAFNSMSISTLICIGKWAKNLNYGQFRKLLLLYWNVLPTIAGFMNLLPSNAKISVETNHCYDSQLYLSISWSTVMWHVPKISNRCTPSEAAFSN